jgi:hypothetical protein
MFLAIGISCDEGFTASRSSDSNNPQAVATYLETEFGIWFDQILLVENDTDCPNVIFHWTLGRDYDDPSDTN